MQPEGGTTCRSGTVPGSPSADDVPAGSLRATGLPAGELIGDACAGPGRARVVVRAERGQDSWPPTDRWSAVRLVPVPQVPEVLPSAPGATGPPASTSLLEWVETGALHRLGDALVVLGWWDDPLTGELTAYVPWTSSPLDAEQRAAVLEAAKRELPQCRNLTVRTSPGDLSWSPIAGIERVVVSKQPSASSPAVQRDDVTLGPPVTEREFEAVARMFRDALVRGYGSQAIASGETTGARLDALAGAFLDDLRGRRLDSVVAELDGEVVGHATWDADATDEVTGARVVELIDVYVLPGPHQRGLARALTAAAEHAAATLGRPLHSEVVFVGAEEGAAEALLGRLLDAGWQEAAVLWTVALRDGTAAAGPPARPGGAGAP